MTTAIDTLTYLQEEQLKTAKEILTELNKLPKESSTLACFSIAQIFSLNILYISFLLFSLQFTLKDILKVYRTSMLYSISNVFVTLFINIFITAGIFSSSAKWLYYDLSTTGDLKKYIFILGLTPFFSILLKSLLLSLKPNKKKSISYSVVYTVAIIGTGYCILVECYRIWYFELFYLPETVPKNTTDFLYSWTKYIYSLSVIATSLLVLCDLFIIKPISLQRYLNRDERRKAYSYE